jgi:hypothetical protein
MQMTMPTLMVVAWWLLPPPPSVMPCRPLPQVTLPQPARPLPPRFMLPLQQGRGTTLQLPVHHVFL